MTALRGNLKLINSRKKFLEVIESYIKKMSFVGGTLQILEAGCGRKWDVNLDGVEYILTGVDLDKYALEIRKNMAKDLHETIEGDLRTVELKEKQYDMIYNSCVLEHINGAEKVLGNFVRWIKPTGIIILRIPDPHSVYGFISRFTPHWFHILCYRFLMGKRNAGKKGYAPYPVCYDSVVSRKGIRNYCDENNLYILAEYGYAHKKKGFISSSIHFFEGVVGVLSFGLLSSSHKDLLYILQKQ